MLLKFTTADQITSDSADLKSALSAIVALGIITQDKATSILAV
jgi:hypothetical protein